MPPLKTVTGERAAPAKGRGATLNPEGRFEELRREEFDDGWDTPLPEEPARPRTTVTPEKAKSLIQRNESPDVPFNFSINPYRGCEHGCIYCMAGDTPILMGDGRTRPLAELRVGDVVYGTARQGWYRRYVKTRVLAHWRTIKPAYRIILQDGTRLVAGGDHRFLTERGWKFVSERHACDGGRRPHLTTGDKLMGTGAFASPPAKNEDYRRRASAVFPSRRSRHHAQAGDRGSGPEEHARSADRRHRAAGQGAQGSTTSPRRPEISSPTGSSATTATLGPATPISTCRRAWISRPGCSPK